MKASPPGSSPSPATRDLFFACTKRRSWLLLPAERIAVLRHEGTGRIEIMTADGQVVH